MLSIFSCTAKYLSRERLLLLWALLFSILLVTLFSVVFSSLNENYAFEPFRLVMVRDAVHEVVSVLGGVLSSMGQRLKHALYGDSCLWVVLVSGLDGGSWPNSRIAAIDVVIDRKGSDSVALPASWTAGAPSSSSDSTKQAIQAFLEINLDSFKKTVGTGAKAMRKTAKSVDVSEAMPKVSEVVSARADLAIKMMDESRGGPNEPGEMKADATSLATDAFVRLIL